MSQQPQLLTLPFGHSTQLMRTTIWAYTALDVRGIGAMLQFFPTGFQQDRIEVCRPFGVAARPAPNKVGGYG
jgi:hypothetical protein